MTPEEIAGEYDKETATLMLAPQISDMQSKQPDKHYLRKHGANAYYGQN